MSSPNWPLAVSPGQASKTRSCGASTVMMCAKYRLQPWIVIASPSWPFPGKPTGAPLRLLSGPGAEQRVGRTKWRFTSANFGSGTSGPQPAGQVQLSGEDVPGHPALRGADVLPLGPLVIRHTESSDAPPEPILYG